MEKLPFSDMPLELPEQNNVFLIDWLTVVFHGDTVAGVMLKLGLTDPGIPWESKSSFKNGYPMETRWGNISILWGADDPAFYKSDSEKTAEQKVRRDMGICLVMSGQGCRQFEQFSSITWNDLIAEIFRSEGRVNITRLDLAYDDHIGLLDIYQIANDVKDRNYVSKSRNTRITWSDDQDTDIQGLTIEIGSRVSPVLIRIYNKAAERGYGNNKHWVRVELQLNKERAYEAGKKLFQSEHIGKVASGILRNYLTFRVPSCDSNKSRWSIAEYWDKLIMDMQRISVWIAPGEPYNFAKSENHLIEQYGQIIQVCAAVASINGRAFSSLLDRSQKAHPNLKPKYHAAIAAARMEAHKRKLLVEELRKQNGIENEDYSYFYHQEDFAEILAGDAFNNLPDNW